jgi:ferrous iron transport protein A
MRTVLIHNRVTMDAVAVPAGLRLEPGFACLATLAPGTHGRVIAVGSGAATLSALERRLLEFGFVNGEQVEVLAEARPGRDPFVVRVGHTTLALRRREAQSVWVELQHSGSAALPHVAAGQASERVSLQHAEVPALTSGGATRAPAAAAPQTATTP